MITSRRVAHRKSAMGIGVQRTEIWRGRRRQRADVRERNGKKKKTRKEGWRSPRESQRTRTGGDEEPGNLGTTEFSRAKPPAATEPTEEIYIHTLLLGPWLDNRQTSGRSTLEKRITRLGNVGHEGPDRCVWLVRNLNITIVSLRGPVPRTGPLRTIPCHPLRSREWCGWCRLLRYSKIFRPVNEGNERHVGNTNAKRRGRFLNM